MGNIEKLMFVILISTSYHALREEMALWESVFESRHPALYSVVQLPISKQGRTEFHFHWNLAH
jgi:hypothetical protein